MSWLRRWARRVRLLLNRGVAERALDEEMLFHIECETAERIRQGMSPEAARRSARVDFGGIERFKEEVREARGTRPIEDLGRDLHYAVRVLRRNPAFTAATILTFALGLGASTAIFSVVYGVLLRPLPYAEPDELVVLWEHNVPRGKERNVVSVDNFEAWRRRGRSFSGMAALVPAPVTLAGDTGPERVSGAEVSPGYFRLLGVAPAQGRDFDAAEDAGVAVVMLSDAFWRRRLGGDPGAVGRTLPIAGKPHRIVGVMPAGFDPPRFGWLGDQELWLPFTPTEEMRAWGRFLLVVARLRPGVAMEQARGDLVAIARQRAREDSANEGWSVSLLGLAEQVTGDVRTSLLIVLCAVGLLLLMAVTNVATLILSFLRRREQELGIRRAVGATDGRLLRQLFAQSALVGAIGTAAGLLAAVPGVRLLLLLLPPDSPRMSSIRVDSVVLLVTGSVAVLATLAFATLAPLRGGSRTVAASGGSGDRTSARRGSRAVALGFHREGVVTARVALSGRYASPESQRVFFSQLLERVRAIPGVASAGLVSIRPFGGLGPATAVSDPRRASPREEEPTVADIRFADAAFFQTLGIAVRAGAVGEWERPAGPPRIVINETLARTFWPSESPLGRQVAVELFDGITAEVVAVVGDVYLMDPRTPPRATAYLSASRYPSEVYDLVVRADGDPARLIAALRAAVAELDPGLPLYQAATLEGLVDESLARDRFTTALLGGFALLSLVLAGVGVYGVFSGDVARRRKEIGIRLALGAQRSRVLLLILGEALAQAAVGVGIGTVAALGLARTMAALLFGIGTADPLSYLAVAVILLGVAAAATLIPAVEAARASPVAAVRNG